MYEACVMSRSASPQRRLHRVDGHMEKMSPRSGPLNLVSRGRQCLMRFCNICVRHVVLVVETDGAYWRRPNNIRSMLNFVSVASIWR